MEPHLQRFGITVHHNATVSALDHQARTVTLRTSDGEQVVRHRHDPVAREDRAFLDALRGGHRDVPVPYDEALRTHAAVCAADESARRGGTVVEVADVLAGHTVDGRR